MCFEERLQLHDKEVTKFDVGKHSDHTVHIDGLEAQIYLFQFLLDSIAVVGVGAY